MRTNAVLALLLPYFFLEDAPAKMAIIAALIIIAPQIEYDIERT